LAYRIGRAYAAFLQPRQVAVGHDVRLTSPALSAALAKGLLDGGAGVLDIGLCGTEEIYFADLPPPARRRHHGHRQP
jgi:phosphomannomutase